MGKKYALKSKYILEFIEIGAKAIINKEEYTADLISDFLHNHTSKSFSSYRSKMYDLVEQKKEKEKEKEN